MLALTVVLALLAAVFFAASAALQQHAARSAATAPNRTRPRTRITIALPVLLLAERLVHSPVWMLGWLVNLLGFLTQAAALHVGSVAVVQPLLVAELLFALPISAAWQRTWPGRQELLAAASISVGLTIFLSVRGAAPLTGSPDRPRLVLASVCAVLLVAGLVLLAIGRIPAVHVFCVAVATGVCFAMTAVYLKLTSASLIERGVGATAAEWSGYALAATTAVGLLLEQQAFSAGPLPLALATMTMVNPIAAYLVGVFAFQLAPPSGPAVLSALAVAGALLTLGSIGLAYAPNMPHHR